ncbi:4-carboxymucolactone decarboxylase [Mycena vitilis]|nr:4-carboxymucolactone decarboxylase [Mycena vitilis]
MKPMQELTTEVEHTILGPTHGEPFGHDASNEHLGQGIDFDSTSSAGLEPKQRSLINIALLASQGKAEELAGHVRYLGSSCSVSGLMTRRGAIGNGATELEIRETLLQAAVYCGIPTGMASFRIAEEALKKLKE